MDREEAGGSNGCLYEVLGVERTSSPSEIRAAYRKLAMKWHPDKCIGSSEREIATTKFQDVHDAYSVLSDDNKRFLYDSGLLSKDEDEGMQGFMKEMASMMSANAKSSFDELQDMFNQMLSSYVPNDASSSSSSSCCSGAILTDTCSTQSLFGNCNQSFCVGRQDYVPLTNTKQRMQRKAARRRKVPYNQGTQP